MHSKSNHISGWDMSHYNQQDHWLDVPEPPETLIEHWKVKLLIRQEICCANSCGWSLLTTEDGTSKSGTVVRSSHFGSIKSMVNYLSLLATSIKFKHRTKRSNRVWLPSPINKSVVSRISQPSELHFSVFACLLPNSTQYIVYALCFTLLLL